MKRTFLPILIVSLLGSMFFSLRRYSALKSINSYEACATNKGSVIQNSYPSICITKLGTKFTEQVSNQKYTNTELGFSFDYPSSLSLDSTSSIEQKTRLRQSPDLIFKFKLSDNNTYKELLSGEVFESKLSVADWVKIKKQQGGLPETLTFDENQYINNIVVSKYSYNILNTSKPTQLFFIWKGTDTIFIVSENYINESNKKVIDEILYTFRFTNWFFQMIW